MAPFSFVTPPSVFSPVADLIHAGNPAMPTSSLSAGLTRLQTAKHQQKNINLLSPDVFSGVTMHGHKCTGGPSPAEEFTKLPGPLAGLKGEG